MNTSTQFGFKLLDGKTLSDQIKNEILLEVKTLKERREKTPHLAAILVGNDGASETYVASKVKACEKTGFISSLFRFENSISSNHLLSKIDELNENDDIDGILVQLPLPEHISVQSVTEKILPRKDVDGFHPENIGRMAKNQPCYIPATPFGILKLIECNKIETEGKHCVVIGRSDIVGYPMSILMARKNYPGNCTVTLCHSKTPDIARYSLQADILIVALGKPGYIISDMVKQGAVVIDVGITRVKDNSSKNGFRLKGDVQFDKVAPKCSYITPVPGGVGPMTIAGLLTNTLLSAKKEVYG